MDKQPKPKVLAFPDSLVGPLKAYLRTLNERMAVHHDPTLLVEAQHDDQEAMVLFSEEAGYRDEVVLEGDEGSTSGRVRRFDLPRFDVLEGFAYG